MYGECMVNVIHGWWFNVGVCYSGERPDNNHVGPVYACVCLLCVC